ncbi:MAG TPA: tetratricopeptide repeat protein, partial [Burkholderiaceae bacterium]|nr:tetratricopeptide repeat protein [Burkholderiaceae bacterium]
QYEQAYGLLAPFVSQGQGGAGLYVLLGESALQTQRPQMARELFERALEAEPGSVDAHLGLGRAYVALGEYARAKIEFETVLRFDDLPPDLQSQAEIYAAAAAAHARGQRLLASGYALLGYGNYRVGAVGGGPQNDAFVSARIGGNLNYELSDGYALDASLDYRFRDYDADGRRNDSDLRWNGAVSRNVGEGNWVAGLRGRVSYRGDGQYRNDFGIYGNYRLRLGANDQVAAGLELRQRRYPNGPLRERTRNIVEATGSWTHSLLDGKASFTLAGQAGREFNTQRADGDANFFGLSPSVNFSITENLGGFAFLWWQNDRYHIERLGSPGDALVGIGTRNDNLYEIGAGLTWQFARAWSLNPEILYIRDSSNILAVNYSSTEIWMTLRWDF